MVPNISPFSDEVENKGRSPEIRGQKIKTTLGFFLVFNWMVVTVGVFHFRWKCLTVKIVFHLTHVPFTARPPSLFPAFRAKIQNYGSTVDVE